jgi:hypothetical protein
MSDPVHAILNRAFVRIYRSFSQYMRYADPDYDVGANVLPDAIDREFQDAERLGRLIVDRFGPVNPGMMDPHCGALHFLSIRHLLPEWTSGQARLVNGLEEDRARLEQVGAEPDVIDLIDEILQHERDLLGLLREQAPAATSAPT